MDTAGPTDLITVKSGVASLQSWCGFTQIW